MDFSDIYYVGGQSFVTVQDKADSFSTLADANKADYQIGAQLGSIQADLAKENTPDADIVELSKVTDIIAELLSGKLDGAFIETVVAEAYAKNYPALCVKFAVPYEQGVSYTHLDVYKRQDLRGGAAMVIGALCARGESELAGTAHLKRGYAELVPTLRACGADITER